MTFANGGQQMGGNRFAQAPGLRYKCWWRPLAASCGTFRRLPTHTTEQLEVNEMAHTLFDVFQGGVPILDSQTALAVQTLLESQVNTGSSDSNGNGASSSILDANLDDDDVFQCGKCKKQFSSLVAFVHHKRQPCVGGRIGAATPMCPTTTMGGMQSAHHVSAAYTTASASFPQMVLNEADLLSLDALDAQTLTIPGPGDGVSTVAPYVSRIVATTAASMPCVEFTSSSAITSASLSSRMLTSMAGTQPVMVPIQASAAGRQSIMTAPSAILSMAAVKSMPLLAKALAVSGIEADDDLKPLLPHNLNIDIAGIKIEDENILCEQSEDGTLTYSIVTELQAVTDDDDLDATTNVEHPKFDAAVAAAAEGASELERRDLPMVRSKKRRKTAATKAEAPAKKANKLKCLYCEKGFAKNFDLQQHIRSHTGEKPFQCIVCGRAFAQKSNVKKHMLTHKVWPDGLSHTLPKQPSMTNDAEASKNLPAQEQSVTPTDGAETLESEVIDDDSTKLPKDEGKDSNDPVNSSGKDEQPVVDHSYICQYCGELFKTYCQLKTHRKAHKNQQVFKCIMKNCGQTFQELDSFLEHTKSHENEMNYRCHVCSNLFGSLYDLGIHQYSHNAHANSTPKAGMRQYRCKKCLCRYSTPAALDHHMATSSHSYACPHCDKVFPCERYLRRHLTVHNSAVLHACAVCQKSFKTEHYLRTHMLIHSGDKPFECCQCQARFNRKDKLKRHLLIHEPVKRFKCPFRAHTGCTKEFHRPDKLKAHIITHSGIRPYQCRTCGRGFSRRAHLREHQLTHRDEHSKFSCLTCGKGFVDEVKLKEHVCGGEVGGAKRRKVARGRGRRVKAVKKFVVGKGESGAPRRVGRPRKKPAPPSDDLEAVYEDTRQLAESQLMLPPGEQQLTEMTSMVEFSIPDSDGHDDNYGSVPDDGAYDHAFAAPT